MAMLKKVAIQGFRSIKEAAIDLGRVNVLIGANGSGKSNCVSFFKLVNEMNRRRLQLYVANHGFPRSVLHFGPKTTPQLNAELTFATDQDGDWDPAASVVYRVQLSFGSSDALFFSSETMTIADALGERQEIDFGSGHRESNLVDAANTRGGMPRKLSHLLDGIVVYHFHDTSNAAGIRMPCKIVDNRQLKPDAYNLAAMLYLYKERHQFSYQRVLSTLRHILPDFDGFELEPNELNPDYVALNWRKRGWDDYLFGPHQFSDGSLRAIALIGLLLQPKENLPELIIVDEPELGLHPHAQEIVAGLFRSVSHTSQVIVATQSQTFLDYFSPEEVVTVECNERGQSIFQRQNSEDLREWLEDYTIGELWQKNVIGGGPLT